MNTIGTDIGTDPNNSRRCTANKLIDMYRRGSVIGILSSVGNHMAGK